jgi:hypothetical protein
VSKGARRYIRLYKLSGRAILGGPSYIGDRLGRGSGSC